MFLNPTRKTLFHHRGIRSQTHHIMDLHTRKLQFTTAITFTMKDLREKEC